jgi:hypothetical protein
MNMNTTVKPSPQLQFRQCHWILRAYVVFALLASVLFLSGFFARELQETIVPFTGWVGLSYYMYTLYFAKVAMFTPNRKPVYGVALLLGFAIVFGGLEAYQHLWGSKAGRIDNGNPYLIYHPARPAITVALPAFWLALLISPSMKRWIKNC